MGHYAFGRYASYTRAAVAEVLAPEYAFKEQVGTWGLHGIVRFGIGPNYAFFVTIGQVQGEHRFDEAVYESGLVRWQSQPRQDLKEKRIQDLISHDEKEHDILLFLRTRKGAPYIYMGPLKYVNHDRDRQNPVHFNWQLIDFDSRAARLEQTGLRLLPAEDSPEELVQTDGNGLSTEPSLLLTERPAARVACVGVSTRSFKQTKIDYAQRDSRNRLLGMKGERLVAVYERTRLLAAGRTDLAEKVEIVSETVGDGAGYDIRSFDPMTGAEIHIEVKTTTGPAHTHFFMSSNEHVYGQIAADRYVIYRLYDYDPTAPCLSFFTIRGTELMQALRFDPEHYRVTLA